MRSGAEVIAVARTQADLDELAQEGSCRIEPWVTDVRDEAFLTRIKAMADLDILVNNAGGNRPKLMVDVDDETLDWMIDLNIRSVYRVARAAARAMGKGGVIVNMSSQMGQQMGHVGSPKRTVCCMTKHAVEGLTKAMAVELAPRGIWVVSIAPTFVLTPMTHGMFEDAEFRRFVYSLTERSQLHSRRSISPPFGRSRAHSRRALLDATMAAAMRLGGKVLEEKRVHQHLPGDPASAHQQRRASPR